MLLSSAPEATTTEAARVSALRRFDPHTFLLFLVHLHLSVVSLRRSLSLSAASKHYEFDKLLVVHPSAEVEVLSFSN